ncbi:MAG: HEPN domain-containing protein [Thermomicrobiales bacterium]|nr:HEPN domain-containing protein [Thermomicrobiales bacterium]
MPPERRPPDDPQEWPNRAHGNLVRARATLPGVYLEDCCFDAQQAAEKAIKAVLLARGVAFPPIHDLAGLLTILGQTGEVIPPGLAEAARLTRFAVSTRYPGIAEPVTVREHQRAVVIAETVVQWAEERVGAGRSGR